MFLPHSEPLLLSEAGLHGLCASLNSPVLNIDELPVGPARAAIALYAGEYGALRLAVGVRSLESGSVAVFVYSQDLNDSSSPAIAMDLALGFAEGMGFLFDEDLVGREGRAGALRCWLELTSEAPLPGSTLAGGSPAGAQPDGDDDLLDAPSLGGGDGELLLEDLALGGEVDAADLAEIPPLEHDLEPAPADLSLEPQEAIPPAVETSTAASVPAARAATLTKFRRAEEPGLLESHRESAPAPPSAAGSRVSGVPAGGNELGRIPLVRRRVGSESRTKSGLLLRLLGSF
jgi:hypothetical protein